MESSEGDVESLRRAIEKLLDEKRKREAAGDSTMEDDDQLLLLSRLFSQLESVKGGRKPIGTIEEEEEESVVLSKGKHLEESVEELAKDIKKVKRQNTITHVLLSAMLILTVVWQLSEFSLIFSLKERISHPVRSIGDMFSGVFKGKNSPFNDNLPGTSKSKEQSNGNDSNTGAHLPVPELLQQFGLDEDED